MSETLPISTNSLWADNKAIYIETAVIILVALYSLFLQNGSLNSSIILEPHGLITIFGSLGLWFANRYVLDRILQSRIEEDKINQYLPFELLKASVLLTATIYIVVYAILIYAENSKFELALFLQGFSLTIGFSVLIMVLYVSGHFWKSWWSDGQFLIRANDNRSAKSELNGFISIKNAKGTVNFDLQDVQYFISESKIVFLVDTSGKRWITQYNLSELEKSLGEQFFRLNRRIMVSRPVISHIKKLPNHRLAVTIGQSDNHSETISRYKSTRFKQWFHRL